MTNDPYETLRRKLNMYPIGMPAGETAMEILRTLFTPEEAGVAAVLQPLPFFKDAGKVAAQAGLSAETAQATLKTLAARGLVIELPIRGKLRYIQIPVYPGLFELTFMSPTPHPQKERLARLWETYHENELSPELHDQRTPAMRVVPVRKSIEPVPGVYRFEDAAEIVEAAYAVALGRCACRTAFGHCDKPTETCISFNIYAKYLSERGFARSISPKEAMDVLESAAAAGLVHTSANVRVAPAVICNCCSCCCGFLRGLSRMRRDGVVAASNYRPERDEATCNGCGGCAKVCPVGETKAAEGRPAHDDAACLGCGLCERNCERHAIRMRRRDKASVPPKATPHLMGKMYVGKLGKRMKGKR